MISNPFIQFQKKKKVPFPLRQFFPLLGGFSDLFAGHHVRVCAWCTCACACACTVFNAKRNMLIVPFTLRRPRRGRGKTLKKKEKGKGKRKKKGKKKVLFFPPSTSCFPHQNKVYNWPVALCVTLKYGKCRWMMRLVMRCAGIAGGVLITSTPMSSKCPSARR